jgi:hypothetical protein
VGPGAGPGGTRRAGTALGAPGAAGRGPAGLGDVAELGEPWAAATWHAAVAVASGWVGNAAVRTPWGYPPPAAYGVVPGPRYPQPAPARPRPVTAPRWLPTPPLGVAHA